MKRTVTDPNLRRILKYAMCLFVAQFVLGFTEGLLLAAPGEVQVVKDRFVFSVAASLLIAAALFFVLSMRHNHRRWLQASAVLLLYTGISLAFGWLVGIWLEGSPAVLQFIEWFGVLIGALLGTVIGALLARRRVQRVAGIET